MSGIRPSISILQSLIVISDCVNAARPIKEPTSIKSGNKRCSQPPNSVTPVILNKFDPTPVIFAPILFSMSHNCCKYGSQAAL